MFKKKNSSDITWRAEFKDWDVENEYYSQVIFSSTSYIRYLILLAGMVYFALVLWDYRMYAPGTAFVRVLVARLIVLLFAIGCAVVLSKTKVTDIACGCITFFPLVLTLSYIFISNQLNNQSFTSQAMIIMVVLYFTTLMPNRWMNLVSIDGFIVIVFLFTAIKDASQVSLGTFLGAVISVLLTLSFAIITQYRLNVNQREKYLREKQLEAMSMTDKLTNLYNRMWFDKTFSEWCNGDAQQHKFALVLLDIDDFKQVNDRYGHLAGDTVLVECSRLVQQSVRQSDLMARWGGEEFMLLLPHVDLDKAVMLAERMRQNVADYTFDEVGRVTCSFGVVIHKTGDTMESMIRRVDEQLYYAKNHGKNQVAYEKE